MSIRRICIVGPPDYPLLSRSAEAYVSGESPQHVLLARAWRHLGLGVSVVLELARQLPRVNFTLAGGVVYQDYYDEVAAAAARLPNVTMLGHVPYEAIGALFARSRVFLNTSSVEGFPNTLAHVARQCLDLLEPGAQPDQRFAASG